MGRPSGLMRYIPSGVFFCRTRYKGKLLKGTLETTDYAIARERLPDYKRKRKQDYDSKQSGVEVRKKEPTKWKSAADAYSEQLTDQARTGAIRYHSAASRQRAIRKISHYWPSIDEVPVRAIDPASALKFFGDAKTGEGSFTAIARPKGRYARVGDFLGGKQSDSSYNVMLGVARQIVATAQDEDAKKELPAFKSPFQKVRRAKSKREKLVMPTDEEWLGIVEEIRNCSEGYDKLKYERRALLAEFMSVTGARWCEIGASRIRNRKDPQHPGFRWTDMRTGYNIITNAKKPTDKQYTTREVPWFGGAQGLMERIRSKLFKGDENALVFEGIGRAGLRCALSSAIRRLGLEEKLKDFTQHKIRHLFSTKCTENNVDWKKLAEWLGHEDGGRLAAELYSHFRKEGSAVAASNIFYGKQPAGTPKPSKKTIVINGKEFTEAEVYEMASKFESMPPPFGK
jgi:integrase